MAKDILNNKYKTGGSPHNDYVEDHGGVDAFVINSDAASFRNWTADQAYQDSDEAVQLEAVLNIFNSGGLTELTPLQQRIFQLCVVETMPHELVATQLKITRQMVEKHLSRACKTIETMAELQVKRVASKNPKWTKEMIREVAKKLKQK
jgi:DNA-directed RNA polymerase specialized sigma24 family protein